MTIAEFLQARIAEDNDEANSLTGLLPFLSATESDRQRAELLLQYVDERSSRLRLEVEAKRLQMSALDTYVYDCELEGRFAESAAFMRDRVLWHMTLPYRDHPDFDERWKP